MSRPLVSVIIPAFNAAETIGRALDSVGRQVYPDIEAIVVDDGSTDGTGEIVRERYPEVTCVRQENAGVSAARNTGAAAARGEFLVLLDADDEWDPRYVDHLVDLSELHPDAEILACNAAVSRGKHEFPFCRPPGPAVRELSLYQMLRGVRPPGVAFMVRRETFLRLGGFDAAIVASEDLDVMCRVVASGGKLIYSIEPLYRYRLIEASLSGRSYAVRARGHVDMLMRFDPRAAHHPWKSSLTGPQYSWMVATELMRGAMAAWREGKREVGLSYLDELAELPAPSLTSRACRFAGHRAWAIFGIVAWPHYMCLRGKRALGIWGVFGLIRQAWRRWVG